jgi:hypothetical protein
MSNNRKSIFVDIDETLIHAGMGEDHKPEVPTVDVMTRDPDELYKVSLRPGAIKLLFDLRTIGHVYALTRATQDYAFAMNKTLGLGFPSERIYSRLHVREWRKTKIDLDIPQGQNYLIDDLDYQDNYEKIALLRKLGPVQYIKVVPFWGNADEGYTHEDIDKIVEQITNTTSKGTEEQ